MERKGQNIPGPTCSILILLGFNDKIWPEKHVGPAASTVWGLSAAEFNDLRQEKIQ